jgi:hypothetical protein
VIWLFIGVIESRVSMSVSDCRVRDRYHGNMGAIGVIQSKQ